MKRSRAALGVGGLLLVLPAAAHGSCPQGNLLEGREVIGWAAAYRPEKATDGVAGHEGNDWRCDLTTVLGPEGGFLTYDLGASTPIDTLFLQADADDAYQVDLSPDGTTWSVAWQAGPIPNGRGLASRTVVGLTAAGRYLRVSAVAGDGRFAIAELQAFCGRPAPSSNGPRVRAGIDPPSIRDLMVGQAGPKIALGVLAVVSFLLLADMRRRPSRAGRIGLLLCGGLAAALALGWTVGPIGVLAAVLVVVLSCFVKLPTTAPVSGGLGLADFRVSLGLGLLALSAACAWTNFGSFHGYWSVHYHDGAHYFLGAKYAPELGYQRLYQCAAVAERQERRWPVAPNRALRNLQTNEVVPLAGETHDAGACTSRFTPARWASFRRDVAFFQAQLHPAAWSNLMMDHGYNATPVWTLFFRAGFRDSPASSRLMEGLAHLDEAVYLVLVPMVFWGFGVEAGVLALLVMGLGFPWTYLWTGGGVGRSLWLFFTVGGLCLARRERPWLAGASLGAAAAIQAFPAALLAGPTAFLIAHAVRSRSLAKPSAKILVAAGALLALLALLALATLGVDLHREFLENTLRHVASPSLNRLGLGAIVPAGALRWAARAGLLLIYTIVVLRVATDWERVALSTLVLLAVFQLSSYYLVVLMCLAPVAAPRGRRAVALLGLVLATQLGVLLIGGNLQPAYYAAISLLAVAVTVFLMIDSTRTAAPGSVPASAS